MSSVKLNLNDFKHVSSDNKTTKLKHKDGHFLVLAHKALGSDAQKQLGALSKLSIDAMTPNQSNEMRDKMKDGGPVDRTRDEHGEVKPNYKEVAKNKTQGTTTEQAQTLFSPAKMLENVTHAFDKAEGGQVQRYAEGTKELIKSSQAYAQDYKNAGDPYGHMQKSNTDLPAPDEAGATVAADEDTGKEFAASEKTAKETIPQEINRESDSILNSQPQQPQQPKVDNDRIETQKIYNSMVSSNVNDPNGVNTRTWAVFGPNGEPPKAFDASSWAAAEQQQQQQKAHTADISQSKVAQIQADNQVRQRAGLPPIEVPGQQQTQTAEPQIVKPQTQSMEQPAPQAQPDMANAMQDTEGMMQQGYGKKLAGIEQTGEAQANLATQQAEILNKSEAAKQDAQLWFKKSYDNLDAERKAHIADIQNGYIDPDKYWQNHSKIASGIGMILSGFNPAGQPNAAIDLLKYQMNQNIEAQKQNLNSKQNLLTANLRQFGNLRDALDMTRLMQNDLMQNQLAKAAATAQNPLAKAAALNAAGALQMESAPLFQQFAMRRAMMGIASNPSGDVNKDVASATHMVGYMRAMGMAEQAKEMESRIVPGVGVSPNQPVPQGVRDQLTAHQQLDDAAKDLYKWTTTHTTLVPGTAEYNVGAQKAQNLQQLYRHGSLHTVYREGEQPLLDKVVNGNPAGFLKYFSSIPKLKEVMAQNDRQYNVLKKNYGLPMQQSPQQNQSSQAAMNWAKSNPNDPRAKEILKRLGQ